MRLRSGKAVQVTAILVLYNISVHKYKEAIIELILGPVSLLNIPGCYFTLIRMFSCTSHDLQSISVIFTSVHVCLVQRLLNVAIGPILRRLKL